jgi:hypothetical protein
MARRYWPTARSAWTRKITDNRDDEVPFLHAFHPPVVGLGGEVAVGDAFPIGLEHQLLVMEELLPKLRPPNPGRVGTQGRTGPRRTQEDGLNLVEIVRRHRNHDVASTVREYSDVLAIQVLACRDGLVLGEELGRRERTRGARRRGFENNRRDSRPVRGQLENRLVSGAEGCARRMSTMNAMRGAVATM